MKEALQFYINGEWVDPATPKTMDVIDPSTEEAVGRISLGSAADVDKAVAAAQAAFESFSQTSQEERVELLGRIVAGYQARIGEMAETISMEMGAPAWLAKAAQAPSGLGHFAGALGVLKDYDFVETRGTTNIVKEPVGVCGLITPLELADQPDSPARWPRRSPRAARWCSSRARWRRSTQSSSPRSSTTPAFRQASST